MPNPDKRLLGKIQVAVKSKWLGRGFDLIWEVRESLSEKVTFKQRWEGKVGVDQMIIWSKIILAKGLICVKVSREERAWSLGGTEKSWFTRDRRGRQGDGRKATDAGRAGSYRAPSTSISLRDSEVWPLNCWCPRRQGPDFHMLLPRTPWSFSWGKLNLPGTFWLQLLSPLLLEVSFLIKEYIIPAYFVLKSKRDFYYKQNYFWLIFRRHYSKNVLIYNCTFKRFWYLTWSS